jgi:transcriptional regulator with XRE-family HTH domain
MKERMGVLTGTFIREARQRANLTQVALSEPLGYGSSQHISNIERGVARLPEDKIVPLSKLLGVSPEALIEVIIEDLRARALRTVAMAEARQPRLGTPTAAGALSPRNEPAP